MDVREQVDIQEAADRERVRALGLELSSEAEEQVVLLLWAERAQWHAKLDRAIEICNQVRGERDRAEALLLAVEEAATAPDYMPPYRRVPRFTMPGRDVLRALGLLERYAR